MTINREKNDVKQIQKSDWDGSVVGKQAGLAFILFFYATDKYYLLMYLMSFKVSL